MTAGTRIGVLAGAVAVLLQATFLAQKLSDEEIARRRFGNAKQKLQQGNYIEALTDLTFICENYPSTAYAGDALLQIALYHLETSHGLDEAMKAANRLLEVKSFQAGDAVPMGYVVRGRIKLLQRKNRKDLTDALADFDRALAYLKDREDPTQTVPAAFYFTGQARYLAGDSLDAEKIFRMIRTDYRASEWAAKARLFAGVCLTASGRPMEAMKELQRVQDRYPPGTPEAVASKAWNTILYRLHVLPGAGQAPFRFATDLAPKLPSLSDALAMVLDPVRDDIAVATSRGVQLFGRDGAFMRQVTPAAATGLFLGLDGRPVVALRGAIQADGAARPTILSANRPNGTRRPLDEVPCGVVLLNGDVIVSDKSEKRLVKLVPGADAVTEFASISARRLAIDRAENIAVLDDDTGRVTVLDRDGKNPRPVPPKVPTKYEFDRITDVAYDPLGNLYVLDRGSSALHVFDPNLSWILTFTVKEKLPGAFRRAAALGLDSAGRLFIYDERAERILTFR